MNKMETQMASAKLAAIIKDMTTPSNYYAQPFQSNNLVVVLPGKIEEWIGRLSLVKNHLEVKEM